MSNLEAALALVASGKRVFPCAPKGKPPIVGHGYLSASNDPDTVTAWWTRHPEANIGMPTDAANNLFVLDVDLKSGGDASLAQLVTEFGPLPPTRRIVTPSGGWHYYFDFPEQSVRRAIGVRPGIDLMGEGGYVLVPPSYVVEHDRNTGEFKYEGPYAVVDDVPQVPVPTWCAALKKPEKTGQMVLKVDGKRVIPEGQRDDKLFSIASYYRDLGDSESVILEKLVAINVEEVRPPLEHRDLVRIAKSASKFTPTKARELPPSSEAFHTTDMGNARRLVVHFGSDLRYLHDQGAWLVWDGMRWRRDEGQQVVPFAKQAVLSIYREASEAAETAVRERLGKHAAASESNQKLQACVSLARSEPEVAARSDEFDTDDDLLNCASGTINLAGNRVAPHHRGDRITRITELAYDPEAQCPEWLAFLDRIMDRNTELIEYLRRAAGYSLTGHTREQCLFMLYGTGANGKSTFLETLCDVWGEYAMRTQFSTWVASERGEATNEIARLAGVRLVVSNEAEGGARLAESLVKQVTGGDRIRARFLYHESFEFTPAFKLWVAVNHKPTIRGTDEGIWRRIKLIPFEVVIPPEERDPRLREKLRTELPGILAWAVRGAFEWTYSGLMDPEQVCEATREYRDSQDTIKDWIDEAIKIASGHVTNASEIYSSYKLWCEKNGFRPTTSAKLGIIMADRGFKVRRSTGGKRLYDGIRLASDVSDASDGLSGNFSF